MELQPARGMPNKPIDERRTVYLLGLFRNHDNTKCYLTFGGSSYGKRAPANLRSSHGSPADERARNNGAKSSKAVQIGSEMTTRKGGEK